MGRSLTPAQERQLLAEARNRRGRQQSIMSSLSPEQVDRAQYLVSQNPTISASLLQSLTQMEGVDPEIERQIIDADDGGGFWDSARDLVGGALGEMAELTGTALSVPTEFLYEQAIKPAIRGVSMVADGLAQEIVQRPLTALGATFQGEGSFGENWSDYGDSALVNFAQGQASGEDTFGKGFFGGGQAEERAQAERTLMINGRRADIGQAIAANTVGTFSNPGDRLYDAVAGISGFAVDVGLDPLAWATGGTAAGARIASKLGASSHAALVVKGGMTGARRRRLALGMADAEDILQGPERMSDIAAAMSAGGAYTGRTDGAFVDRASDFFRNDELFEKLADMDAYDIGRSWRDSYANRMDRETINALGQAKTKEQVATILLDQVAHGNITSRGGIFTGAGHFVRESRVMQSRPFRFLTPDGKYSGLAPLGKISVRSDDEIATSVEKLDSFQRQLNIDKDVRREIYNKGMALTVGDTEGLKAVYKDVLIRVGAKHGDEYFENLIKQADGITEGTKRYGIDMIGDPIDFPHARRKTVYDTESGEMVEQVMATPQLLVELSDEMSLQLPEIVDLRRAAVSNKAVRRVYESMAWDIGADSTRWITQKVFKPAAILRPAYTVRIGMEEQARLSAAGYDSIYNHPFRFLMANIMGRKEMKSLTGEDLWAEAEMLDVVSKKATRDAGAEYATIKSFDDIGLSVNPETGILTKESYIGWRTELGQLAADPMTRKMTELRGNIAEFSEWAAGDGRKVLEKYSKISDDASYLRSPGSPDFDKFARSLVERIEAKMGGSWDDDLAEQIANRTVPPPGVHRKFSAKEHGFRKFLSDKYRDGVDPGRVKIGLRDSGGRKKAMDSGFDAVFDFLVSTPTDHLARFPTFRQAYIKRGAEAMDGLATDELRAEALARFSKNLGLGDAERRALEEAAAKSAGRRGAIDSIADLDEAIKIRAGEDAKNLLYDNLKRGAQQDAFVAVAPFLDAWKEVSLTWTRMLKDNPAFFIRAQAGYQELGDQGTFYVNEFGEEVFRYGGGGALATFVEEMNERGGGLHNAPMAALHTAGRVATGDTPDYSVRAEGRVSGLNMIAQGIGPGFGPVVQWGASTFDSPEFDQLREIIAPFGTGVSDPGDLLNAGWMNVLAPAWAQKAYNAWTKGGVDERQWNSTFGDSMNALSLSGRYDPGDPEDLKRMEEDAKRYAMYQLWFRSSYQAIAPTGPTLAAEVEVDADPTEHPEWDPENDRDGRMFFLSVMRKDYYELTEKYGDQVAAHKFYEMYGKEPYYLTQAKTSSGGRELPVTKEGDVWMRRNADLAEDFDLVAGYWVPLEEDAPFDFSVYANQIVRGERESLSPEKQMALANKARSRAIIAAVRDQNDHLPAKYQRQAVAQARAALEAQHPGVFQDDVLVSAAPATRIGQLNNAAFDRRVDGMPLTQPLREYMAMRADLLNRLRLRTGSPTATFSRADASLERRQLRSAGMGLSQKSSEFLGVWSSLLLREVEDV